MDMRINSISYNYSFKSNSIPKLPEEGITMGYDDSISSSNRNFIRDHLEEQTHLKYLDYYEMPKSDFAMDRMLKSWGLKTDKVADKIIVPEDLNCIPLGNNNFRASLPAYGKDYKRLKDSGIKTIISATSHSNIKDTAERNGLKYIELVSQTPSMQDYIYTDYAFMDEDFYMYRLKNKYGEEFLASDKDFTNRMLMDFNKKSRNFIDNLVASVQAMQQGGCLIGCDFGIYLTNSALDLIDTFNPQEDLSSIKYLKDMERDNIGILYKKLTPDDKKAMGWTEEFEEKFQEALKD